MTRISSSVRPLLTRSAFLLCTLFPLALPAQRIAYTLAMPEPWTHCFLVTVRLDGLPPGQESVDLRLPVWRSGRYRVLDFAGGVVRFSAADAEGEALRWEKVDKTTWRVAKGKLRSVEVKYTVYADEFTSRTRGLNAQHGFVDGTAVFMYLDGSESRPVELRVEPYPGWRVTTSLPPAGDSGFLFHAPSYGLLADCPIEIGTHRVVPFTVAGKPHILALYGTYDVNLDTLVSDISLIVKANAEFWGGLPYDRYVFLIHAIADAGGGTEHASSCVIGTTPVTSRTPLVSHDLSGVLSHEFFHTWNVKQFRPKGMNPYDWREENYYRELWLVEGGTTYMHGRVLNAATGNELASLDAIAGWVQGELLRPGNREQSLAECSFDAWIKFWRRSPQTLNFEVDLYGRGALMCGLMDLEIRHRSENRRSFGDLIRTLYRKFPDSSGGYTVEDVAAIAGELAGSSMQGFFDRYIYGTEVPDWPRFLGYAGLIIEQSPGVARPWWGAFAEPSSGPGSDPAILTVVVRGSAAAAARLQSGDAIIALDSVRVTAETLPSRVGAYAPGDTIRVALFREERLMEVPVPLHATLPPLPRIRKSPEATLLQRTIYASWTGAKW